MLCLGNETRSFCGFWSCTQKALAVKNPPGNVGNERDVSLIPGSGRFPGIGDGNLLQCFCLEHFIDRRAWQVTVHGVTKSWTQLSTPTHPHIYVYIYTVELHSAIKKE